MFSELLNLGECIRILFFKIIPDVISHTVGQKKGIILNALKDITVSHQTPLLFHSVIIKRFDYFCYILYRINYALFKNKYVQQIKNLDVTLYFF